jgi:hypothetical protein
LRDATSIHRTAVAPLTRKLASIPIKKKVPVSTALDASASSSG